MGAGHLRDDFRAVPAPWIGITPHRARPDAVCDGDPEPPGDLGAGDDDGRPAVLESVRDEVVERLREPGGVALDWRRPGVPVDADPVRPGGLRTPALHARHHRLAAGEAAGWPCR